MRTRLRRDRLPAQAPCRILWDRSRLSLTYKAHVQNGSLRPKDRLIIRLGLFGALDDKSGIYSDLAGDLVDLCYGPEGH